MPAAGGTTDGVLLSRPRAPCAPLRSQLCESHYLTAWDPAGGRALWLRYTSLKHRGAPPYATVWVTLFEREAQAPVAIRVSAEEALGHPGEDWLSCSLGAIGPAGAHGSVNAEKAAGGLPACWQLGWQTRERVLAYLPAMWLYDRVLPRSNGAAIVPAGTASGRLCFGANDIALDGWELMVGHNWGSDHAEEWCWLHVGGLGESAAGWLDLVLVKVGLGPLTTPWIAAGACALDGRHYRPAPLRRVSLDETDGHTNLRLAVSPPAMLELCVMSPPEAVMSWDYESPAGSGRQVTNCSLADARVRLHTASEVREIASHGSAAIERGRRLPVARR